MVIIDKFYRSEKVDEEQKFEYDKRNEKRPSWLKLEIVPERVQFMKILVKGESFWYRQIFGNYFIILEATTKDIENFYNYIAKDYESMMPQNKKIGDFLFEKLKKFNIPKNSTILEMCAGTGIVAEVISNRGYQNLTLIDLSDKELKLAKKRLSSATIIKCDVLKVKLIDRYRVIYESMGFDNFKEAELTNLLKNIKNHLTNDGLFIAIDRHIPKEFGEEFKTLEKGNFSLETLQGKFRYDYFIGKKQR